jgi:hypothetical protein
MNDNHFFADVDLPFHVWVRERSPDGDRWVLREAPQAPAHDQDDASAGPPLSGEKKLAAKPAGRRAA